MSAECLFCLPNEPLVLDQLVTFYQDIQPYLIKNTFLYANFQPMFKSCSET